MVEHRFRKAGVPGPNPGGGSTFSRCQVRASGDFGDPWRALSVSVPVPLVLAGNGKFRRTGASARSMDAEGPVPSGLRSAGWPWRLRVDLSRCNWYRSPGQVGSCTRRHGQPAPRPSHRPGETRSRVTV